MGESKRRKTNLGEQYGQEQPIAPWLPITKSQAKKFYEVSTKGAWAGIVVMIGLWLTVRFVGPGLGWWSLSDMP